MAENQEQRTAALPATTVDEDTNLPDLPTREGLRVLWQIADFVVKAGMAGDNAQVGGVAAQLIAAREEGIGTMKALSKLFHVPGSSGLGSLTEVKIAKFNKAGHHYKVVSNDGETCVLDLYLRGQTPGESRVERVELTREYCDRRGWTTAWSKTQRGVRVTKDNWERDPDGMLFNRTFSYGYRRFCPECEYIRLDETVSRPVLGMDDVAFLEQVRQEKPEQFQEFMRAQVGETENDNGEDVVEGEYEEEPEAEAEQPGEHPTPEWAGTEQRERLVFHATQELKLTGEEVCEALGLDSVDDLGHYPPSYRIAMALLDDYYEIKEQEGAEPEVEEIETGPQQQPKANGKLL